MSELKHYINKARAGLKRCFQSADGKIVQFLSWIYELTGSEKSALFKFLDKNYYNMAALASFEEDNLLLFHVKNKLRRYAPNKNLCPSYHALKNYDKNFRGKDVVLECRRNREEPTPLDFHGASMRRTLAKIASLAQADSSARPQPNGIPIFTSLSPSRIVDQQTAIATWLAQGFTPVAVNYPDEIAKLEKEFPEIVFLPAVRDSLPELGRRRVFLTDIFQHAREYFRNNQCSCVGIVNSDVSLYRLALEPLVEAASNGLAFSRRADVPAHRHDRGVPYDHGYDAFFFNPDTLPALPESPFALGEPWWDLVVPLWAVLQNVPVAACSPVICFHVDHPVHWSEEAWFTMGQATYSLLEPLFKRERPQCPDFYQTVSKAKECMHHPRAFWDEFAFTMNHIVNTVPCGVDAVVRRTAR